MKMLLFGKNGQVGWELQRSLAPLGHVVALSSKSFSLCGDLNDPVGLQQTIRTVKPDVIINAAAYTAVDKAEEEHQLAYAINALGPGVLAEEAKRLDAWLIHYSTDYVFDGTGSRPRTEADSTGPLNIYGKTKRSGEKNVIASGCRHLILRTSWVYAVQGKNFIKTILKLARERDCLQIVDDQVGSPTGAELIADITAHLVQSLKIHHSQTDISGLYHLAAHGYASWYGVAHFILTQALEANVSLKTLPDQLQPIASIDYPTPAKRPLNSRLDTSNLQQTFHLYLPEWQVGVQRVVAEILTNQSFSSNPI